MEIQFCRVLYSVCKKNLSQLELLNFSHSAVFHCDSKTKDCCYIFEVHALIQRGRQGWTPPPPGKSQVIWFSIRNRQLDPPAGKSCPPPPPPPPPTPWKMLDPLWNLGVGWWGEEAFSELFLWQMDLDPPPPPPDENFWIRSCRFCKNNKDLNLMWFHIWCIPGMS